MSKKATHKKSINIQLGLDKERMPIEMYWSATDSPKKQECKALLLSMFDKDYKDTLKIDLWTKEMQVVEMDRFMYQTLKSLADTYFRATKNQKLAGDMQRFAQYFAEETEIIPRES